MDSQRDNKVQTQHKKDSVVNLSKSSILIGSRKGKKLSLASLKTTKNADHNPDETSQSTTNLNDEALERLAAEELSKEAGKAKARVDVGGPSEWTKKPKKLNMRFVVNSVLQTEAQNRRSNNKK